VRIKKTNASEPLMKCRKNVRGVETGISRPYPAKEVKVTPNEPFIGEDNMIMGSDYGHQDQSKEDGMVGVMRRKKSISSAVIEKILCDNPRRFYGL
jgi:predicted TIM-barrel fold metal-dependent hydrolase